MSDLKRTPTYPVGDARELRYRRASGKGPAAVPTGTKPRWTPENRRRANHNVLVALEALWDQYPDQRFGQLVMNLSRDPGGGFHDTWEWHHQRWFDAIGDAHMEWSNGG
jgi:hypothetical protein